MPSRTTASACAGCHKDPHAGRFTTECQKCHTATAWKAFDRTQFDHIAGVGRDLPGPFEGFFLRFHLDDPEAADDLLGLDVGAVGDSRIFAIEGDPGAFEDWLQAEKELRKEGNRRG